MMGRFLTDLKVERIPNGKWRLLEPLIYESRTVGVIIAPTGFETDFASVPRIPFAYWFFGGMNDKEGVIHDWLYNTGHVTFIGGPTVTRCQADAVLPGAIISEELTSLGDCDSLVCYTATAARNFWSFVSAWAFWAVVRLFARGHWR